MDKIVPVGLALFVFIWFIAMAFVIVEIHRDNEKTQRYVYKIITPSGEIIGDHLVRLGESHISFSGSDGHRIEVNGNYVLIRLYEVDKP